MNGKQQMAMVVTILMMITMALMSMRSTGALGIRIQNVGSKLLYLLAELKSNSA